MLRYLVKRLLVAGVTLWGISLVTFVIMAMWLFDSCKAESCRHNSLFATGLGQSVGFSL